MTTNPRASIVVLTYNRRDEVLNTLARLARNCPGLPVIAVDNGSTDGTARAIGRDFPDVELVALPTNLGAAGRNHGVAAARTPYVAFCDDDTCWEPGAIELAVDILDETPTIAVVNAHILVGTEGTPDPACEPMAASPLGRVPQGTLLLGFMAGACVMRVQAFRAVGGYWPPFFIGGEESLPALDFAARGWQMVYAPAVVTRHWPSPLREAVRRRRLLARNAIWTAWLRLPPAAALAETRRVLREEPEPRLRRAALRQAVAGSVRVARHRRVVPDHVVRMLTTLRTTLPEVGRP